MTYRIKKNHALIHNLQKVGHVIEVVAELLDQLSDLRRLYFDNEWVWKLDVLGWNYQVICLGDKHLYKIKSIAKVVLTRIQRLLFYYLVHVLLVWLHFIHSAGVALDFLVELPSCGTTLLSLYYEIRPIDVVEKWVFAYVRQDLFSRVLLFLPIGKIIIGFLLLESFQYHLIFFCYLHKFTFARLPVQTLPLTKRRWLQGHFIHTVLLLSHVWPLTCRLREALTRGLANCSGWISWKQGAPLLLKNICHLF